VSGAEGRPHITVIPFGLIDESTFRAPEAGTDGGRSADAL
jgi:hypothetical protein